MPELEALQHIYSNVEADQSPAGRGGFQTLFASAGLTRDEISEIEERVVYFADEESPEKRVFHALSSGRVTLSHITPLRGKDMHGRGGRYLAHTLVFEQEAFEAEAGTPFAIFRSFPFVATVDAALAAGDTVTGQVPAVRVAVPRAGDAAVRAASEWPPEALASLATLAIRAGAFAGEHVSVAFTGAPAEVESALEVACLALPNQLVPLCSFDTHFHGGNLAATYFWGIGVAQPSRNPRVHNVDASGRSVGDTSDAVPTAPYERWVARTIERRDFPAPEPTRKLAFAVCEWLDGRADACPDPPSDLLSALFEAAPEAVRQKLALQLAEHLPPLLAPRAQQCILADLDANALYALLRVGTDIAMAADSLWKAYGKAGYPQPEKDERKELGALLESLDHRDLEILYACGSGNIRSLRTLLDGVSGDGYTEWVERCTRYDVVEPHEVVIRGREALLATAVTRALGGGLRDVDLAAIVDARVSLGATGALDALIPLLGLADAGSLKTIGKRVRKEPTVSARFRAECDDALAKAPKRPGLFGRVRRALGRDDEEE